MHVPKGEKVSSFWLAEGIVTVTATPGPPRGRPRDRCWVDIHPDSRRVPPISEYMSTRLATITPGQYPEQGLEPLWGCFPVMRAREGEITG